MVSLAKSPAGAFELLLGNEAIARGALEAGVKVAAAYPGTPSSEIIETLARLAKESGIYVEWSVNEKVAAEVASAGAFAGMRSLIAMKHEGLNVALDFLAHLNLTQRVNAGFVVIVADDPQAWSSASENDSRHIPPMIHAPLLEPSSPQQAKDMMQYAFDLSEELGMFVMVRSCTRLGHGTGKVVMGEMPVTDVKPRVEIDAPVRALTAPMRHLAALDKLEQAKEKFEESPWNIYEGPDEPDLLLICTGPSALYAQEAVELLDVEETVGILSLGTTYPLPSRLIEHHISRAKRSMVLEEVDPFVEDQIKKLAADRNLPPYDEPLYGKGTGHISPAGELNPDEVLKGIARVLRAERLPDQDAGYSRLADHLVDERTVSRGLIWCPGCPHRGTFWSVKNALKLDGRDGFVTGDIGCYGMDAGFGGFGSTQPMASMGTGAGVASGLGKLTGFGFDQPVISVAGDSTFFHAVIPALVNATYNRSNFTLVVVDNSATAMTGFQPHAGVGKTAMGDAVPQVDIEKICRSLDIPVEVLDPFELSDGQDVLLDYIQRTEGVRVLIMKRECFLTRPRDADPDYKVTIDKDKCLGDACGCNRYCTRAFKCPGLYADPDTGRANVDEAVCVGCGLCTQICPEGAIQKEAFA
ncbi:MAG: indolepyruvate ferredoxin oxidoreductase [Chloroflexi bacterium]|jgi:indolepyruvate ferredoxin oxidoreductase alpha subunit|nr:indolepyruvate ferredoxin oxidoreductase [Chloroflexota bacterium]MDP6419956.1 thiamine pyrophosphate-dependent enzyme [SAR202 cluster bacterium]MDP6665758.1 thiamine pyrophosphate-dependent enzyme [SAR202 cluster bacterium]MDP6798315.1 thiamine pyrophosphate-dependent enzyme [SAR202 cluster bacterium]MQG59464.1 indolepyruvate ferredoxin oxidoreductase [SAR202 cluster bacterium]|tara:strand:+ start:33548 stop:35467 length:1920 start_codon:yes stop_codon:yes gene_type:complete